MATFTLRNTILAGACLTGACSMEPAYKVPETPSFSAYEEVTAKTQEELGNWRAALPAEGQPRGEWWVVFGDKRLNELEAQAATANQDIKAAAARVEEARALQRVAHSEWLPQVGAGFGPSRQLNAPESLGITPGTNPTPQTVWRAQLSVSYELDLFGRIAATNHAAAADTQQSEALYKSAQLALQADVAQTYFLLRESDAELGVLKRTVELRHAQLDFIQHRFDAGDVSELDVAQARTEVQTALSDAMTLDRERATSEHALAVLLGEAPAQVPMPTNPIAPVSINIPADMPSALLERRPDIAAAERAMAAANARVGIARSAFFPSLTLTGTGGYESSSLSDLFKWSNRAFLLGPLVGTPLVAPIFDGGQRRGNLARATAEYREDVAVYRQTVLVAFREVEDGLVNVRILRDQTQVEDAAVQASARAAQLSRTQYEDGQVNYLDVIETERTLLETRRRAIQLQGEQATFTVQLIRALGGGWGIPNPQSQAKQQVPQIRMTNDQTSLSTAISKN
ncbi:efflux transporter outer membrane subunit [Rhodanobacter sp. MP7CTX1]|uniref:efflux transporter outer membrane subunit n=1 Tax=Rhodanobacter sp. MP7CTX1 TaxID=2723084 RepID=UPI001621829A|nr:efflux transporter outer membrane subunit [Rhodanobacter sp. MP7CTX1]MBB6187521.1 multidrug efflux system outer membrane protein [Rhodanobacter sp. MP7CTX1]